MYRAVHSHDMLASKVTINHQWLKTQWFPKSFRFKQSFTPVTQKVLFSESPKTNTFFNQLNNRIEFSQLSKLNVDNSVPIDQNNVPRTVKDAHFVNVNPLSIKDPNLIAFSKDCLQSCLSIILPSINTNNNNNNNSDDKNDNGNEDEETIKAFTEIVSGNPDYISKYLSKCDKNTYSHCYCGHQFGSFAGQLGDGRALSLGEFIDASNNQRWEVQLKGSGRTPFSRFADGRAVLRSSVREFLMSEAMYHLNIGTTRSGTLVLSEKDVVLRDRFYNGNVEAEPIAVITRIAPSFIRFGSFEIVSKEGGPSYDSSNPEKMRELTLKLLDYIIEYHYPEIWNKYKGSGNEMYVEWWCELVDRTVRLVMEWQCVGFVHGVLNTDNMSILGLTIDYGPFGMMEYFDSKFIPNYSDKTGRYCFQNQINVFKWNLYKLAELFNDVIKDILPFEQTLLSIEGNSDTSDDINDVLAFDEAYWNYYVIRIANKFGFGLSNDEMEFDETILPLFWQTMEQTACDFTNIFRNLNQISILGYNNIDNNYNGQSTINQSILNDYIEQENTKLIDYLVSQCATVKQYIELQSINPVNIDNKLKQVEQIYRFLKANPNVDQLGGLTVDQCEKILNQSQEMDQELKNKKIKNMTQSEKETRDRQLWTEFILKYRQRVDAEYWYKIDSRGSAEQAKAKSKSEAEGEDIEVDITLLKQLNQERLQRMNSVNPKWILRNYLIDNAIQQATEDENYGEISKLLSLIEKPFDDNDEMEKQGYSSPVPESSCSNALSCSS